MQPARSPAAQRLVDRAFMTSLHADAMTTAALWLMAMLALIPARAGLWAVLTRRCEASWSVAGTRLARRRL
jgi:hypothetical protein